MTEEQLCELPIPKWLGRPMYPAGFPLRKDQVSFGDKTVQELFLKYCDDRYEKKIKHNPDDEEFLCYYVLYYIHAPIWVDPKNPEYIQELLDTDFEDMPLDDLIQRCMEFGIDPL
jgi:hypothetical protein